MARAATSRRIAADSRLWRLAAGVKEGGIQAASPFFPYPVPSGDARPDELVFIKITTVYAAAALVLYYWFSLPLTADRLAVRLGIPIPVEFVWVCAGAIAALAAVWIIRTFRKETPFVEQSVAPKPARVASGETLARLRAAPAPTQKP